MYVVRSECAHSCFWPLEPHVQRHDIVLRLGHKERLKKVNAVSRAELGQKSFFASVMFKLCPPSALTARQQLLQLCLYVYCTTAWKLEWNVNSRLCRISLLSLFRLQIGHHHSWVQQANLPSASCALDRSRIQKGERPGKLKWGRVEEKRADEGTDGREEKLATQKASFPLCVSVRRWLEENLKSWIFRTRAPSCSTWSTCFCRHVQTYSSSSSSCSSFTPAFLSISGCCSSCGCAVARPRLPVETFCKRFIRGQLTHHAVWTVQRKG